jgi:hypothetical protein
MRTILTACILIITSVSSFAQKRPSQKEMDKMMKEAKTEMEKLKKDPEYKDIIEQVEKMNQPQTKTSPASPKKDEGNLMKLPPAKIPTKAQSTDRLLWYTGKKVNDSMIVTAIGEVVKYSRKSQQVVVQLPARNSFSKLSLQLKRSEDAKDDFVETMAKSRTGYFIYPFVKQGLEAMDEVDKNIGSLMVNTVKLPATPPGEKAPQETGQPANAAKEPAAVPNWLIVDHADIMNFVRAHEHDSWAYAPPPPMREFDFCEDCDTAKRNEANRRDSLYMIEFSKNESLIVEKAMKIAKYVEDHHRPAELEPYQADAFKAVQAVFKFARLKCKTLLQQYGNDFPRLAIISRVVIAIERQQMLVGLSDQEGSGDLLAKVAELTGNVDKYIDKLITEKDYRQLLNYKWIVGLYRERVLLGEDSLGAASFAKTLQKLEDFNRFKLTIDATAKLVVERDDKGEIKHVADSHLKGEEYYTIYPDAQCDLRVMNNKRSEFKGEAMNADQALDATQFKLKVIEAKSTNATYVAPMEWMTITPYIRFNFCKTSDTLVLYGFNPKMGVVETWRFPKDGDQHASYISESMAEGFPVHEITREVSADLDEKQIMKSLTANFSQNSTLHDMELKNRVMLLETNAFSSQHTGGIYLTGGLSNGNTEVFVSELDGKPDNPNPDILAARLSVKLQHAPFK